MTARRGGAKEAPSELSCTPVPHSSGFLPATATAEPTSCKSTSQWEHKYNLADLLLCTMFLLGLIKRNAAAHSHVKLPITVLIENFIYPINVN